MVGVRFYEKAKSIAPGQSAVFYEGDEVIGGGIIQRAGRSSDNGDIK
jgi:tRNA-specific 2-thiouridylase